MIKYYYVLALLIVIISYSCDDNPTVIKQETEPTSSNITFTPDTLFISENMNENFVQFEGIDFVEYYPDSVRFDSNKVVIVTSDRTRMLVYIPFKKYGKFAVNIYFKTGLITLDSSITLMNDSIYEPAEQNIYFTPDTLMMSSELSISSITLKGTNFNNKIDSVLIGGRKCIVTGDKSQNNDSSITEVNVSVPAKVWGNLEVIVYLSGKEIILSKKLVVLHPYFEVDFTQLNKLTWEIRNIPRYEMRIVKTWSYINGFESSITYDTILYNSIRTTSREYKEVYLTSPISIQCLFGEFYNVDLFSYDVDTVMKGNILNFNHKQTNRFTYNNRQDVVEEFKIQFASLPYKINYYNDNKIEVEIKISGKEIDNYLPFFYYSNSVTTSSSKYSTKVVTISKKDSLTGKDINYFPASDSSLVLIRLRNY
ncbi:MAG: IPT/TIG domain-containing protein [Candidatus Kapaibacterium sp.]|jgi:hypothetical protein